MGVVVKETEDGQLKVVLQALQHHAYAEGRVATPCHQDAGKGVPYPLAAEVGENGVLLHHKDVARSQIRQCHFVCDSWDLIHPTPPTQGPVSERGDHKCYLYASSGSSRAVDRVTAFHLNRTMMTSIT